MASQSGGSSHPSLRKIGRYEITGSLGAGGMGEVYRAWDPGLHRDVALKLLPENVAADQLRRRRFLDEARAVGALSHPNILAVYDVDVENDVPFIVTELVDGRRLRDEIDAGPVSTRRLLDLAGQMAGGLRAAHDSGITHRDLKPENVMITRDGRVKILDFGLAMIVAAAAPGDVATQTITSIAGTPQYMSPEQAAGSGRIDFRSDQFSFGTMLYEMAAGVHPFRRETAVQTMSAIVSEEPEPISRINGKVPVPLRWVIERCLAKEPADRYASTADLVKDLATLQARISEISVESPRPRRAAPAVALRRTGLGLLLAVVAVGGVLVLGVRGDAPQPEYNPLVIDRPFQGAPAWSSDGVTFAYVSVVDGILQLFTRRNEPGSRPQQRTFDPFDINEPFWSPDRSRIFYHRLARRYMSLWSIGSAAGMPELVLENALRGTISQDGRTLVFLREEAENQPRMGLDRSLWTAAADGSNARRYMEPPFDTRTIVEGVLGFSPDGTKLLAWVWGWSPESKSYPTAEFWIIPWPDGRPYRVMEDVVGAASAPVAFDWFPDNRHIVIALWAEATTGKHLSIVDTETGERWPLTNTPGSENRPAIVPGTGGSRISFGWEALNFDLVQLPLDGGPQEPFLATTRNEVDATFTRDGSQYAFLSDRDGKSRIVLFSRDGKFDRAVVDPDDFGDSRTLSLGAPALSPDGRLVAYQRYAADSTYQIYLSPTTGAAPPLLLSPGAFYQDAPTWSPDGQWVAYVNRDENEVSALVRSQVGVAQPPQRVVPDIVTSSRPKWSPVDDWIVCEIAGEGLIVIRPDGTGRRLISTEQWAVVEWSEDGQRIYGIRASDDSPVHYMLAEIEVATGEERVINPRLGVVPPASDPILGLARAGPGMLVTSVAKATSDIYLLDNVNWRRSWLDRWLRMP